ncbi:hypothetical protein [Imhoffiella purpurea]|uniref:hypothetical protein n=1 Tax=Imhoffiella purpurea TaxID=1249627 RepID=UPI0005C1DB89|nr:hypothetical protein [Imhoffiella purpurea]
MKSRINHTGRKSIPYSRIHLQVTGADIGRPRLTASINLEELDLPPDARVHLEAYHREITQRFDCGTVAACIPPEDVELSEVAQGGRHLFRLKVVSPAGAGHRLLATAERMQAHEGPANLDNRESLITVVAREHTGGVPWALEMDTEEQPALVLNSAIPGALNRIRTDAVFRALILPALVREVLTWIFDRGDGMGASADSWQGRWIEFGTRVTGGTNPPVDGDPAAIGIWVEAVVSAFCTDLGLCDSLATAAEESTHG